MKPPRPPLPSPPKPSNVDDLTITASQSTPTNLDSNGVVPNSHPETVTHDAAQTQLCSPLTSTSGAQTDQWDQSFAAVDVAPPPVTSSHVPLERPKPRPRSRLSVQPISNEVKVQTLVKLRDDGLATLAARSGSDAANQEVSQGKYLQELLEAFSSDDWGFPERRSDSSEHSQSESEDGEDEEDMATLKARIQAFEQQQQQQQVADGSCGDSRDLVVTKRPEPRPRPRLQGQPAKSVPPIVAPKPKNVSHSPKPSGKAFWEDEGGTAGAADTGNIEALKTTEAPSTDLNPQTATEPGTPCLASASPPVPAPRPSPPKPTPSVSETLPPANPKPPPRPPIAPRASVGAPNPDKSTAAGRTTPPLPPRPSAEVGSGAQTETQAGREEAQDAANQTGEFYSLKVQSVLGSPGLKIVGSIWDTVRTKLNKIYYMGLVIFRPFTVETY